MRIAEGIIMLLDAEPKCVGYIMDTAAGHCEFVPATDVGQLHFSVEQLASIVGHLKKANKKLKKIMESEGNVEK